MKNSDLADYLDKNKNLIAERLTQLQCDLYPEFDKKYGSNGRIKANQDNTFSLAFLQSAIRTEQPLLFIDYIGWSKVLFNSLHLPPDVLNHNLRLMKLVLNEFLGSKLADQVNKYIDLAILNLDSMPLELSTVINNNSTMSALALQYFNMILVGDKTGATKLITTSLKSGISVQDIYIGVFQEVQYEVGRLWQHNKLSVAMEHLCTSTTSHIMTLISPFLNTNPKNGKKMIATCVSEELHDIGIRMVSDLVENSGWESYYLGSNTPDRSIVEIVRQTKADVLGLSVTISYHLKHLLQLIEIIKSDKELSGTHIIVGGYPFKLDKELWKRVGADSFAEDAIGAVQVLGNLVTN